MRTLLLCLFLVSSIAYAQEKNIVAVIGAGPSGLSAAYTCQSFGYQTIIFEQKAENGFPDTPVSFWPGVASPKWKPLIQTMRASFTKAGGKILEKEILSISKDTNGFILSTGKDSLFVQAVVLATGKHPKSFSFLEKKSERVFTNFWSEIPLSPKDSVIVIGEGYPFFYACLKAAKTAERVFAFPYNTNETSLEPITRLFPSVMLIQTPTLIDIGTNKDKAFVTYSEKGSKLQKEASYAIIAEEKTPTSSLVKNLCTLDSSQAIVTSNDSGETSLPGLFACGEVTTKEPLSGIQAATDGQKVGLALVKYLLEKEAP